jgi:hypothetical protein
MDEQALPCARRSSIATHLAWLQREEIYVVYEIDLWVEGHKRFTGDERVTADQPCIHASESWTHRAYSPI